MAKKGSLSITSENIFPVIKKWLYSDHDIFYRELISNGCDAITKLKKLELMGEYERPEDVEYKIQVTVNPTDKTIKITDNGLGMTEEEIQKMLDDKVAEGSVQINMNSKLVFKDGKAKGYVRIVNSPNNHYKLVVEMIRKDTSETIYQTGAMDPGNYLEQDRLDVDLPKGDYPVSIHFRNYDRKSEQFVGEAVTENVVHILN